MFKLGTEAGRKGNLFLAFGEIGKGDGRRGECGKRELIVQAGKEWRGKSALTAGGGTTVMFQVLCGGLTTKRRSVCVIWNGSL